MRHFFLILDKFYQLAKVWQHSLEIHRLKNLYGQKSPNLFYICMGDRYRLQDDTDKGQGRCHFIISNKVLFK